MLRSSWEITMADVQFQSENLINTQETTPADQHPVTSENIDAVTEPSNQGDIFDDHQANTSFGWNEQKLSEVVTFEGKHTKSISTFMVDDIKKTEEHAISQNADTAHNSIHDVIPDMDTAGLWISAAPTQQIPNGTNNASHAYNKTKKTSPTGGISSSQPKINNRRLHGITLCISLSVVGLCIYLNSDNAYIKPSENVSHHIKTTYSETLIHVEDKSNEIYKKIISKFKYQQTKTPNIQETQGAQEKIQTDTSAQTNIINRH